jgi:anaerobic magnesium-protoporphyrin IX monomethyl ester cyclase
MIDVLFVNPNSSRSSYQGLADKYAAIEPPTWSLLLAEACRSAGFSVAILDCDAERLSPRETAFRISDANAMLCCWTVYGQNPNSGTTNCQGMWEVLKLLPEDQKQIMIGSHASALPWECIKYEGMDFVAINEGVYSLLGLLPILKDKTHVTADYNKVPGLIFWDGDKPTYSKTIAKLVQTEDMDRVMPGYAWDLLPFDKKPLDLYRAHTWHAEYNEDYRTPFAAIYTSLGCQFKCNFCMINIVNRTDPSNDKPVYSSQFNKMRFWSPEWVTRQFEILVEKYGCETIRLTDEMFFLNKKYYEPILKANKERGYGERIRSWAYARVDTINPRFLQTFREGGVKWLACGFEAANTNVRREIYKGKFQETNIRDVVKEARGHGLWIGGNWIFGHPTETHENMQESLDLACELNTEFANFYTAMALPGSPLYYTAKENGWKLPDTPTGYAFLGYECQPLPTEHLSPEHVLRFRDSAWHTYFERPEYLSMVEKTFGTQQRLNIEEQSKIKLKRKILGD